MRAMKRKHRLETSLTCFNGQYSGISGGYAIPTDARLNHLENLLLEGYWFDVFSCHG